MAWSARVAEVSRETPKLSRVRLEVPSELSALYRTPGQILRFSGDEEPVFLALVSDPGAPDWELLASDDAVAEVGVEAGRDLQVEEPIGHGFDPELAAGRDVVLFGVGSAVGPLRPLVRALLRDRSNFGFIRMYIGVRGREHLAFREEIESWKRDRIDVFVSISKPWVQEVFRQDPPGLEDAVAYVCGMSAMLRGVEEVLAEAGLPTDRIHRNY